MRVLLAVYDNDSFISCFPLGIAYLAAAARAAGHQVDVFSQDVSHWPDERLTELLDREHYDVVGVGVIAGYYQYRKLLSLSAAINASRQRPFYVIGGHGPAPEPAYFLEKTGADCVVIGEGEHTFRELLAALEDRRPLTEVDGLALPGGLEGVVRTPARELEKDVDSFPFPAWDLFPMDNYTLLRTHAKIPNGHRSLPILSGRGCIFRCNFCYRMDKGFRPRSIQAILEEADQLNDRYNITRLEFFDELLMSSEERTMELCDGFLAHPRKYTWGCNGRLNFAKPPVLAAMRRAGCDFINYGIESLDQATLNVMKKGLTVRQIEDGVRHTLEAGIAPGINIIYGNIGEPLSALDKAVDFLLKYHDNSYLRTIRPVTPYPGSDLYYHALGTGLLKDVADFYENKHTNSDLLTINFTPHSDQEVHAALYKANARLIDSYYESARTGVLEVSRRLYLEGDASFRGFRHT